MSFRIGDRRRFTAGEDELEGSENDENRQRGEHTHDRANQPAACTLTQSLPPTPLVRELFLESQFRPVDEDEIPLPVNERIGQALSLGLHPSLLVQVHAYAQR